ncbi:hypothetical protein TrLO_g10982 [Triparma laevis f. longispina]|uniref:TBC1 domain family member 23 n=1 Tax=Triparma laevis f. longispina TaxID=1714387 RepID=A0A9W7DXW5_9STRA|nr:hypothetical protein TrLO_g10982 [Triparma laevis f. longispina]
MDALDKLLLLPSPPRHSVLSICRSLGHIPSSHRGRVYKILLNVSPLPLAASLETKIKRAEATSPPTADSTTTTPPPPTPQQVSSPELTSRLSIDDYDDDNDESVSESINSDNSENSSIGDLEAERELEKQSKGSFQVEGKWAKSPLVEEPKKLVNQRVVKADAERTRGSHPQIERLLTHFCHSNDLKYKQGLNELLAPFLTLDYTSPSDSEFQPPYSTEEGESEKNVFNELVGYGCFEEFLKKFLPTNVYADDGFAALQCCFRIFRLLLLYHDPNLCKLLDGHRLPPELYASGWFLTLFSQRLDMESLWKWWDLYVLYDEPHLHHFICLRLLMRGAEEINEAGEASLPVVLQQLSMQVESIDPVKLLQEARMVSDETPRSFTSLLDRACWGGNYINEKVRRFEKQSLKLVLKSVGAWSCVPISADEGIGFALKDWGIIEPNYIEKNGRTPPRFRNRSRGSSAESRDKLFSGTDEDKTADKPPKPFQDLPSYLTSPTGSHTSYESDMDSMASEFSESEVEDDFSDEEGEGGEENDEDAPTSPVKVKGGGEGASVGVPLPTTPNTLKQSKIIHQRKSSKKKYVLLDCRPKSEFDDCHVYGSIHLDDECWNTGEVASVVEGFKEMKDCHFALIGSGPSSFDLQMSVNAHKTGPSKSWKRKQRLKNASGDVVEKSGGFLKKMAAAMTTKKENDPNKFVPRGGGDEEDDLDPEHMQVGALEEDIAVSRWVCMFLQLDFAHVSYVRGGIKAIVRELKKAGKENGVGLAEGAEATLEGNKVGKSEVDEAMSASGRAIEKMMKNMVGDLSPTVAWMPGDDEEEEEGEEEDGGGEGGGKGEDEVGAQPQGKKPPAEKDQRKSRRSLEGVGKGWNSFVSNASKAFERRSSKEGSEFGGGGGKSNSNSPKNSGGSGGMFGGRMFGGGDKSVGEKSGEGGQKISNDSSRSSELDLIRSELEGNLAEGAQHPSDKAAPMWVRKLSVQMEKAGTGFLMASQKLGEKSREVGNELVEKTKAVAKARSSPRTSLSGLMGRKNAAGYYIGKIVDIGDWIGSVAGNGGSACTFSAMKCPTDDSMWTEEAMTPCQLLIGDGFFLALELNSGTPGAGPIIACYGLLSLNKITTKQNLHGLTVFWFKLGDGEVGEGRETEIQLPFVVEEHRDCIEKVKEGFKVEKKKEKERLKELERSEQRKRVRSGQSG